MTNSPTPTERLALKTANAALLESLDPWCDIVSTVVFALSSAQLLQSPETAAETERLRARVAELERPTIEAKRTEVRESYYGLIGQAREDRDHEAAFNVECDLRRREEQWAAEDRAATAPQRQAEDPHDSPLHHAYADCRDMPTMPHQRDRRAM